MAGFDGVVIGAGHNGLTLAAYLSRAGLKIAVVERNPHIGGGCTTEEIALPGYRFNLHSNFFMGLRHSPLIRDLELYRFGFSYIEPSIQQGAAFRDGTCVVIQKDLDKTCASLARFSARDAETFRELHFLYAVQMRPTTMRMAGEDLFPEDVRKKLKGWHWGRTGSRAISIGEIGPVRTTGDSTRFQNIRCVGPKTRRAVFSDLLRLGQWLSLVDFNRPMGPSANCDVACTAYCRLL
jgi:phytoene dehydrogenase-like protein